MDNLRIITLNLDRNFDTWKPGDAESFADTLARSAVWTSLDPSTARASGVVWDYASQGDSSAERQGAEQGV
jgi:hypothetical protein